VSTTWELHYAAPGSSRGFILAGLDSLKHRLTEMLIDYLDDGDEIHVMVGDIKTLWEVFNELREIGPPRSLTCDLEVGDFSGMLRLGMDGEDETTDLHFSATPPEG
jgi:hypothetical protein